MGPIWWGNGQMITAIARVSAHYLGGAVGYANHAKVELLGVPAELIEARRTERSARKSPLRWPNVGGGTRHDLGERDRRRRSIGWISRKARWACVSQPGDGERSRDPASGYWLGSDRATSFGRAGAVGLDWVRLSTHRKREDADARMKWNPAPAAFNLANVGKRAGGEDSKSPMIRRYAISLGDGLPIRPTVAASRGLVFNVGRIANPSYRCSEPWPRF